jgi:hypothetical protein
MRESLQKVGVYLPSSPTGNSLNSYHGKRYLGRSIQSDMRAISGLISVYREIWIFRYLPGSELRRPNCYALRAYRKKSPWPESASELYRTSDRRLSANLVPAFADRGCQVVSVTDPYSLILGFLNRSRYFFFQVAPQLYSRG